MTVHYDVEHEALADYSILIAESALVLSALSRAGAGERSEELADLRAIHSEGQDFRTTGPLPNAMRQLCDTILACGEALGADPGPGLVERVEAVERISQILAAALDDGAAGPALARINDELRALDPDTAPAADLPTAIAAVTHLVNPA